MDQFVKYCKEEGIIINGRRPKLVNKIFESANNKKNILPFKNKHLGETAVLMGSGMTLKQYVPIENAIHVGVNNVMMWKKKLDYFFMHDGLPKTKKRPWAWSDNKVKQQVIQYKPNIQKFIGKFRDTNKFTISDKYVHQAKALRYDVVSFTDHLYRPPKDLGHYCCFAIYYILWF